MANAKTEWKPFYTLQPKLQMKSSIFETKSMDWHHCCQRQWRYSLANCQSFLSPKELQLKVFCFASLSTKEKGILQLVFHYEYTWVLLPTWNFSKMKEDILLTVFENHPICRIWIFQFWHFPPIFVLLKLTCLVTLFDRKLQVFKNSPKCTIFGIFT